VTAQKIFLKVFFHFSLSLTNREEIKVLEDRRWEEKNHPIWVPDNEYPTEVSVCQVQHQLFQCQERDTDFQKGRETWEKSLKRSEREEATWVK
jgi:hypothetical protein